MTSQPDVTVVIAAYDAHSTIGAAIESALSQEDVSLEVIVVDDCSTDGTADFVARIAEREPRVRLIARPRNGGPGAARNAGFAAAQGRWLAVLDADDAMKAGRLARMTAFAEGRQADIVVDNIEVRQAGEPARTMFDADRFGRRETLDLATFVRRNNPFSGAFTLGYLKPLVRRAFLEASAVQYDCDLPIGEDYLLIAELLAAGGRCVVDPGVGYVYTRRASSTSARLDRAHLEAMMRADERFKRRYPDRAGLPALKSRARALARAHAFLGAVDALKARRPGEAGRLLLNSPRALWHFRWPIRKRLATLAGRTTSR